MSKVIINDVELELDIFDVEVIEKYDEAVELMFKASIESSEIVQKEGVLASILVYSKGVNDALDLIFGAGTSERVFGKKKSLLLCSEAHIALMEAGKSQNRALQETAAKLTSLIEEAKDANDSAAT